MQRDNDHKNYNIADDKPENKRRPNLRKPCKKLKLTNKPSYRLRALLNHFLHYFHEDKNKVKDKLKNFPFLWSQASLYSLFKRNTSSTDTTKLWDQLLFTKEDAEV